MIETTDPEPISIHTTLRVGRDAAGHWLVQQHGGGLEGRFVTFTAAMSFARSESHAFAHATVEIATEPLVPVVSFQPVEPWEMARRKAA